MNDAGDGTGGAGHEDVGSVAEEAAKLLGALSGWAREHGSDLGAGVGDLAASAAHAAHEVNDHIATGSAECTYCPVCRTIHVARSLNPEVKQQLASAAASLMQAAAGVLAAASADERRAHSARGDDIEKIDLDGDWPDEP